MINPDGELFKPAKNSESPGELMDHSPQGNETAFVAYQALLYSLCWQWEL